MKRYERMTKAELLAELRSIQARLCVGSEQLAEARRENEDQFWSALKAADIALWDWDIQTDQVRWSDALERIYGAPMDASGKDFRSFLDYVHPEDRDLATREVMNAVKRRGSYSHDLRIVRSDGTRGWISSRGIIFCDGAGKPARAIGGVVDITDRKRIEIALREREHQLELATDELRAGERKFRAIFDTANDSILIADDDGVYVDANAAACDLLGLSHEAIVGMRIADFFNSDSRHLFEQRWQAFLERGESRGERQLRRMDGTQVEIEYNARARFMPGRHLAIYRDITERKQKESEIQQFTRNLESMIADRTSELTETVKALEDEIQQRISAVEEIRRRNRQLDVLHTIAASVSGSLELHEILMTLVALLKEKLAIPAGAIFFYDPHFDLIELKSNWGLHEETLSALMRLPVPEAPNREAIRRREAILVSDYRDVPQFSARKLEADRAEFLSYLSLPLLAKGEVLGTLDLFSQAPAVFDEDQVAFFRSVAAGVGMAVHHARLFQEVHARRKQLQNLSRRLISVQETERRHIARELHDEIGQILTGLKLAMESRERSAPADFPSGLAAQHAVVDELIVKVRELSLDLRPGMLDDLGLLPTLLWYFERYTSQSRVHVEFVHQGVDKRFRPELETTSYRIIQEALTNVARHAESDRVCVTLWTDVDSLNLQIQDRGRGFDTSVILSDDRSSGLLGMQERARLLGGMLTIDSAPGEGTRVAGEFPLEGGGNRDARRPK